MEENSAEANTPDGNQSTVGVALNDACGSSDSGEPTPTCKEVSETPRNKISHKY